MKGNAGRDVGLILHQRGWKERKKLLRLFSPWRRRRGGSIAEWKDHLGEGPVRVPRDGQRRPTLANRGNRRQSGSHEAFDSSSCLPSPKMSRFKSKKSRQPSQQPAALGIPAHIAAGPLGFGAILDLGNYPEGVLCSIEIRQSVRLIGLDRCEHRRGFSDRTTRQGERGSTNARVGCFNRYP